MKVILQVWRQENQSAPGEFVRYDLDGIEPSMSFLEMLDRLNEDLIAKGEVPVSFDHDCREGICGTCSLVIDGISHGPQAGATTCQLHMRSFSDGAEIWVEPWRVGAFPVLCDLVTDRSAFDRIMQRGGYVSLPPAGVPDANSLPIGKELADEAMDAAACIGCGACAAACKNSSATLFVAAKVSQLAVLPQGNPERGRRVRAMLEQMDIEGFGHCSNTYECEAVCPKEISVKHIARLNREAMRSWLKG